MAISIAHSIVGFKPKDRPMDDFYPTPPQAVLSLLDTNYIPNLPVWEPACGDGAISKFLTLTGHTVHSSDLYDHGYGEIGIDFLTTIIRKADVLITNPPFTLASQFLIHAVELNVPYVFLLAKLAFLEGVERSKLLEETNLSRVMVFRKRIPFTRNGEKMKNSGMIAFAWFCWLPYHIGLPTIQWI